MTSISTSMNAGGDDALECLFFPVSLDSISIVDLCDRINNGISRLTVEYMWHRDEFQVNLPLELESNKDLPVHLRSITCFGDNIEDEWFIVYIILQLTKQEEIIVQLNDSDGDFILIEAADYLPTWANPDNTNNRVFIYKGDIHLVPPALVSLDTELEIKDAIKYVVQDSEKTKASADIQKTILDRIGNYPEKIKECTHNAVVELPIEVAALLKVSPNLIAPIVNTYCTRDVLDEKVCKNVTFDKKVMLQIKFTKCLYAMILHSPLIKRLKVSTDKRRCLGLKLCYGYQIIMNSASSDIYSSKQYQKFIENLKRNGYFNNNLQGSKDYQKLMKQADQYYESTECPVKNNVGNKISNILKSDQYTKLVQKLQEVNVDETELKDDNEDWLKIKPEQLNEMLNSRYGKESQFKNDDSITPQNITAELNNFLKQSSDFEGIESNDHEVDNNIDFDPDQFSNLVEKMLNMIIHNEDNTNSEMNDSIIDSDDDLEDNSDLEQELKDKLHGHDDDMKNDEAVLKNMVASMREEKACTGPSSNLLTTIGLKKTDFIDSDDE